MIIPDKQLVQMWFKCSTLPEPVPQSHLHNMPGKVSVAKTHNGANSALTLSNCLFFLIQTIQILCTARYNWLQPKFQPNQWGLRQTSNAPGLFTERDGLDRSRTDCPLAVVESEVEVSNMKHRHVVNGGPSCLIYGARKCLSRKSQAKGKFEEPIQQEFRSDNMGIQTV